MQRTAYQQLTDWKNNPNRKPLILNGARQVGKTYLLREFGEKEYAKFVYLPLDRNANARSVFEKSTDTHSILLALSAISQTDITPGDTLVFLDEIQECLKALEALKFFCEEANEYHVVVAGSLLGIALHENASFPVGKVDMIRLFPMSFKEFLMAIGKEKMQEIIAAADFSLMSTLSMSYEECLRLYYYVGGMPAAVQAFADGKGLKEIRSIQQQILFGYKRDFSKHAPARDVPRINMVWDSIPSQLARENKKFIYGAVKKGARASEFEIAIQWLIDAGLVYKVSRISKATMPLKFYEDFSAFKLFMLDVGLMGAMVEAPAEAMITGQGIFSEYKGAFTELYVNNELTTEGITTFYHSVDNSTIEIDFVIQIGDKVVPIECKAEENVKSKSLKTFISNNPHLQGMRFSMKDHIDQGWMINIPLYAVSTLAATSFPSGKSNR